MLLTISRVNPVARLWTGKFGEGASVKVWFTNDSEGEYSTKPEKAQEHIDALTALVGKPGEFEVEQRPDFDGVPQLRVKNYPGKVQPSGGFGGRGGFEAAWRNTEPGFRFEQTMMNRRTAIMQAVQTCSDKALPSDVIAVSETYFKWLQASHAPPNGQKVSEPQNGGKQPVRPSNGPAVAVWEGPGQCPECRCPAGAKHATKCPAKGAAPTDTWADETDPFVD